MCLANVEFIGGGDRGTAEVHVHFVRSARVCERVRAGGRNVGVAI